MNPLVQRTSRLERCWLTLLVAFAALANILNQPISAATAGLAQTTEGTAQQVSSAVEKAETAAADTAKDLWQRIDAARLEHRTRDQIVAWIILGVLVGAVAGMMTSLKPTGLGKLGRLLLGLAGAFLGGIVVRVRNFDFGWGPVLIRYEELFFSLVGAILIVLLGKIISSRTKKKVPAQ